MSQLNEILERIRPNRSALYAFFSMMPKGGDLHHHYSGSIYAESYIDYVISKNFYLNIDTFEVVRDFAPNLPGEITVKWKKFSELTGLDAVKLKLLRKWSDKDFVKGVESQDEHFFSTFGGFSVASKDNFINGILELKKRAINQRLNYIETIFISIPLKAAALSDASALDEQLLSYQKMRDVAGLRGLLETVYTRLASKLADITDQHNKNLESYHTESDVDDDQFTLRFQNYCARFKNPIDVFTEVAACFLSSVKSALIVGVNIVAAENGNISMRDYWLHMQFFSFMEDKFPEVKFSIHAGELVSGMVAPEFLGTHIRDALFLKNLKRVGHAVDIIYDNQFISTIHKLQRKETVIEINLSSNEFILGVANDVHPIELYYRNNIPIVICTDDEGVLRTSITEQYVLLAHRYKLTFDEIKEVVKNSIRYSLIEESVLKDRLLKSLETSFDDFEKAMIDFYQPIVFDSAQMPHLKMMNLTY